MATALPQTPQQNFLGAPIKVITTFGEEFEGELFCYDVSGSNSLVLQTVSDDGQVSFKWVRSSVIRDVRAFGPPRPTLEPLQAMDLGEVEERMAAAEEAMRAKLKNFGVGVTEHAQDVFDAIHKTMACEWDREDIIVRPPFDVRIAKPYTAESCSGADAQKLARVKTVLQGELARIEQRKAHDASPGSSPSGSSGQAASSSHLQSLPAEGDAAGTSE